MTIDTAAAPVFPATISEARAQNLALHGPPEEARAEADDVGGGFCEDCYAVYLFAPGFANDGHQCLTSGTDDAWLLPDY